MAAPPLFNFFTYATNIKAMLSAAFPALETVAFPPTAEGFTDSRYSDVALPAFFMNYENPELPARKVELNRFGEDLTDDSSYYMPLVIRLAGFLLLPVFPTENTGVPNVNMTVLLAQAASNVAAKIYAGAVGTDWNCGVATMHRIHFIDDSIEDEERRYHVAELHWHHDVWVGAEPSTTPVLASTVFNRFKFPAETGEFPDDSTELLPDYGDPEPSL